MKRNLYDSVFSWKHGNQSIYCRDILMKKKKKLYVTRTINKVRRCSWFDVLPKTKTYCEYDFHPSVFCLIDNLTTGVQNRFLTNS